jgi:hypothetical protein
MRPRPASAWIRRQSEMEDRYPGKLTIEIKYCVV